MTNPLTNQLGAGNPPQEELQHSLGDPSAPREHHTYADLGERHYCRTQAMSKSYSYSDSVACKSCQFAAIANEQASKSYLRRLSLLVSLRL